MGTRSITTFIDERQREIAVMYRQYDGYPEGHGAELAEFLSGMNVVNGLGAEHKKVANGMDCLAAQVVAHFKDGPGNIYLMPAQTRDVSEEYLYIVKGEEGMKEPTIDVYEASHDNGWDNPPTYSKLFGGPASEVLVKCKTQRQDEDE